jgi:SpoVK/Ycf46/Vps4 family AAA+-type ATPase
MNQTDYTPFNHKKNYKKNKNNNQPNKIININHFHSISSYQDVNKAHDMINKYSLDKPITTSDNHDRYTPLPRGCTPLPSRYSPTDNETIHPISEDEHNKINRILKNDESDMENETSIIYTFTEPVTRNIHSPDQNVNMLRIIRASPTLSPNLELSEIIAKTEHALHNKMRHNTENEETAEVKPDVEEPIKIEPEKFQEIIFTDEIRNIKDLITLSKKYVIEPNTKYSINLQKLNNIVPYLTELDEMVGMDDIKVGLANQLMYFLQDFEYTHMLHTIIEGPPGVGKTCLGKILGKIYFELKCINTNVQNKNVEMEDIDNDKPINLLFASLMNNREKEKAKTNNEKFKFKIAKRSDFVGQYVGHTAVKTQKLINECFGGVLFIDEAYSLGADDPFSKECINTLNQNLSENGDKFICIIAGYADSLESNFFSYNSGLQRRFPFRYSIPKYTGTELTLILKNKINKENYSIDSEFSKLLDKFIDNNKEYLPNYGGDIETLFFQMKMMHAKRVFGKSIQFRKIFDKDDIVNGFNELKKNQKKKEEKLDMYN